MHTADMLHSEYTVISTRTLQLLSMKYAKTESMAESETLSPSQKLHDAKVTSGILHSTFESLINILWIF